MIYFRVSFYLRPPAKPQRREAEPITHEDATLTRNQ
jgi:hypothetical protein